MRFEKEHISDWARSHSVAAGSFASQDDRWQNTNTKRGSHDQVMRMSATIKQLISVLLLFTGKLLLHSVICGKNEQISAFHLSNIYFVD